MDGRPNHRNKAAFSGVVLMRPQARLIAVVREKSLERAEQK